MVNEKVTFIKMDLEGWELLALEGSKRHILEDHPKLAISVYHHPSDFRRIFEFVLALRTRLQSVSKTLYRGMVRNGDVFCTSVNFLIFNSYLMLRITPKKA